MNTEDDPTMTDLQIDLRIPMRDLELVLAALGARPYTEVAQTVHLLASQASPQLLAHQQTIALATSPTEARN